MSESTQAWRCEVCGYIHREPHPPGQCPVCGVPSDQFEALEEEASTVPAAVTKPSRWRCLVCNYEQEGDAPPAKCPICAAAADAFEAMQEEAVEAVSGTKRSGKIVIIGSGIAGISAVESLRQISPDLEVTLLSKEACLPYYRLNLTRFLAGELTEKDLTYYPEKWFQDHKVTLKTSAEVCGINRQEKTVTLKDGSSYDYDKLILTAGAHPFVPAISGVHREGVTTLRDINSARYILSEAKGVEHVVIVGGGILGLEIAGALAKLGNAPTLLERFKWIMPRQLNQKAASLLSRQIKELGISLRVETTVKEIVGDEHVQGVVLNNGETLPAELVIISAGVRSNSYLARLTGLSVNRGIIVNDQLQTSDPDIYAAGDIAEHRGMVSGLWNVAQYQGSIAGLNAAGEHSEFGGIPRSNTIKVLGVDLLSIGRFEPEDGSDILIEGQQDTNYCCFMFRDNHIVGAILYGDTTMGGAVKKAIEAKQDVSGLLKDSPTVEKIWSYFK